MATIVFNGKQSNGKHTLTLYLNKVFIQYKFKIDNEWKYNENYPTTIDNGNKNNYIDTTNWEISAEKSEETNNSTTESFKQCDSKSINLNKEFQNSQNNYCNYFPKLEEMNDNITKTPDQYKNKISIKLISIYIIYQFNSYLYTHSRVINIKNLIIFIIDKGSKF